MVNLDDWLEIGRIVAPQGLKGEMRVYPSSDFPERFVEPGERWLLRPNAAELEPIQLRSGRFLDGKGLYVVQIDGVGDRDQAESLRNCRLYVPVSDRLPLKADEYHVLDLIGLSVFDQATNTLIGTVQDVIPAGNDLLEVALADALLPQVVEDVPELPSSKSKKRKQKPRTVLIPFVKEIVPVVDLEEQRIAIAPPPGLINMT